MPRNRLFRHMIYAFLTHETACSVVRKMPFQPEKCQGRFGSWYNVPSGETYGRIVNGLSACPFFYFMIFCCQNFLLSEWINIHSRRPVPASWDGFAAGRVAFGKACVSRFYGAENVSCWIFRIYGWEIFIIYMNMWYKIYVVLQFTY